MYICVSTLRPGAARPTAVQGASPRLRRVREQKNRFAVFFAKPSDGRSAGCSWATAQSINIKGTFGETIASKKGSWAIDNAIYICKKGLENT